MNSSDALWERRGQSLRFTLGDYCYWQFRFEAFVHSAPLSILLRNSKGSADPMDGVEKGFGAYVIRSFLTDTALPRIAREGEFIRYAPSQYLRYFVAFDTTFDVYLSRFSGKSRSTLKRKIRKFKDLSGGTLDWRQYETPAEMADFYPLALELSEVTYQAKMFGQELASQAGTLENIISLAEKKDVCGYILFLHGKPAAYVFCPCRSGTIEYASPGYDPNFRSHSPGDVLLYLLIERLFSERRFQCLDFGEGGSWYKEFYATNSISCARVYFLRRTFKNWAAVRLHAAAHALTDLLGGALSALRLRTAVRRVLRIWATSDQARAPN